MAVRIRMQVHVVRDGDFYFYNRYEDGRPVVFAERISMKRARQIVEAAEDGDAEVSSRGTVSFDPPAGKFSFIVEYQEVDNELHFV